MRPRTLVAVGTATIVLWVGPLAGSALAHVAVSAPDAAQGGAAALTFEVPSEKDLPTTRVEIALPLDTPALSVTVPTMDGWTSTLIMAAPTPPFTDPAGEPVVEVVSRVVFTATGPGIEPEGSAEFVVVAGTLPSVDSMVFKVLQTYSDGSVASWIQESVDGAPEPEFPAPVLALAPGVVDVAPAPPAVPTASSTVSSSAPGAESVSTAALPTAAASTSVDSSATAAARSTSVASSSGEAADAPTGAGAVMQSAGTSRSTTTTVILVISVILVALCTAGYLVLRRRRTS